MHIQEDDCDLEMLEEADFTEYQLGDTMYGVSTREHALYMIQMTKLSVVCEYCRIVSKRTMLKCIVGHIIKTGFAARKSSTIRADRSIVERELAQWESQVPSEMKYQNLMSELGTEFWSNMLHLAYKYVTHLILPFILWLTSVAITLYSSIDRAS